MQRRLRVGASGGRRGTPSISVAACAKRPGLPRYPRRSGREMERTGTYTSHPPLLVMFHVYSDRSGCLWLQLIQSSTYDDGASYSYCPADGGDAALRQYWSTMFGDANVETLMGLYPPADYGRMDTATIEGVPAHSMDPGFTDEYWAAAREETDFAYRCTKRWASRWYSSDPRDPPIYQIQVRRVYLCACVCADPCLPAC